MEDGLLAGRAQDGELDQLWNDGQPEIEVEDIGAREQARERAELRELAAPERPLGQAQVLVRLRVGRLRVEDDQSRVDSLSPQRLHVRPADAREVDRAVGYSESHSTWSK